MNALEVQKELTKLLDAYPTPWLLSSNIFYPNIVIGATTSGIYFRVFKVLTIFLKIFDIISLMEFLILTLTGTGVGFMSAFFGVGGGGLLLPIMYSMFSYMTPALAIPISLTIISLNTMLNMYRYYKSGIFPSKKTILIFLTTCTIGMLTGTTIINMVDAALAKKVLACILLIMVLRLFTSKIHIDENARKLVEPPIPLAVSGLLGSMLAGLTGLGGGIIFVPIFLSIIKMPVKYVTSFSNVAMGIGATIGVIPYLFMQPNLAHVPSYLHPYHLGSINFLYVAILFIGSFFAGKFGVKWNNKISPKLKKNLLACLLLILGIKTLLGN